MESGYIGRDDDRFVPGNGADTARRSSPQLLKSLFVDLSELTRQEIALVKAEMNEKIGQVQSGLGAIGIGGTLAFAGGIVLLFSLVYALALAMPAWAAALIVGLLAVAIGGALAYTGKQRIALASLKPDRTARSLRRDAGRMREALRGDDAYDDGRDEDHDRLYRARPAGPDPYRSQGTGSAGYSATGGYGTEIPGHEEDEWRARQRAAGESLGRNDR